MINLNELFYNYFRGNNFISGPIFNDSIQHCGRFLKFVNKVNFTYESDNFNSSLSTFTQSYNLLSNFFITSDKPLKDNIQLRNDFDPQLLNSQIEQQNEIVKFVPSFIFDVLGMWCIYFENDADVFIAWRNERLAEIFDRNFLMKNSDFYEEKDSAAFLDVIVCRLTDPGSLQDNELKESIKNNNSFLFNN